MRRSALVLPIAVPIALVTGCASSSSSGSAGGDTIAVSATDSTCTVETTTLTSGKQKFTVKNEGSKVTEAYVYAPGDRAVGEVENIGPGTSRELIVTLKAGPYEVACKPGMTGKGIRQALTVTGGEAIKSDPVADAAVAAYRAYIVEQTQGLVTDTAPFIAAVKAGDIAKAKSLYAAARIRYERIEPVAESFGDLDPRIDEREDDVEAGKQQRGFHRLEKDLWKNNNIAADGPVADALKADIDELLKNVQSSELDVAQIGNGAKELLDEVATSKVTGEEERYSRIDLVDFLGNVEGAKAAVDSLRPLLQAKDPALLTTVDEQFTKLEAALGEYGSGTNFKAYNELTSAQTKALADQVDALSEPLSKVTAAVVGT